MNIAVVPEEAIENVCVHVHTCMYSKYGSGQKKCNMIDYVMPQCHPIRLPAHMLSAVHSYHIATRTYWQVCRLSYVVFMCVCLFVFFLFSFSL